MANLTTVFGIVLILTGIITYFGTGQESMTALIPAIAGIPLAIVGMIAANPSRGRVPLYVAAALVAILALGTLRGVSALIGGDTGTGSIVNTVLFVLSIGYLVVFFMMMRQGSTAEGGAD